MSKSHVSMEQKQCIVCGAAYNTGAILMDTRIRNGKLMESMERNTITGAGLCEEHQKLFDDGYIALVECDNTSDQQRLRPENANRTGNICHIRRSLADQIFNIKISESLPMVFIEVGIIEKLQDMQMESEA